MIANDYLPYLEANARAVAEGADQVSYRAQGVPSGRSPSAPYRAECFNELKRRFAALDPDAARRVADIVPAKAVTLLEGPPMRPSRCEPTARAAPADSGSRQKRSSDTMQSTPSIDVFWSFRSPYSYPRHGPARGSACALRARRPGAPGAPDRGAHARVLPARQSALSLVPGARRAFGSASSTDSRSAGRGPTRW